jgi:hypothetical protein
MIDFDTIINEWSYRTRRGYPIWNDPQDMIILKDILKEMNLNLDSISEASPKNPLAKGSSSTIEGSNTPDLKEGLAVYFATQDPKDLQLAKQKADNPKDTTQLNFDPSIEDKYYGTSAAKLVSKAIEFLNNNIITGNNSRLYLNALSIASRIQKEFGQVDQSKIDRGVEYDKIRNHAVRLVSEMGIKDVASDKWCPADIYIYNTDNAGKEALDTTSLNMDSNSLNAMFNSNFGRGTGIVGISLKEEKAQAGKAKSFTKILKRDDSYPEADAITPQQKSTLELMYNLNQLSVTNAKTTDRLKIGYIAEASKIIISKKLPDTDALLKALMNTLKLTFGDAADAIRKSKGDLKNNMRAEFEKLGLNEITYDPELFKLINTYNTDSRDDALATYIASRKKFIDTLKDQNFNVPVSPKTDKMNAETLYKKSGCYLVASYLLSGLNAQQLQIPPAYKSIIEQKNAFVALTAFAIGMGGISPTFFKLIGKDNGSDAVLEPFYGDGILNLDEDTDTQIFDTAEYKGFYVTFVTKVSLITDGKSVEKEKYQVTLDFRYAGDQLNIEVSELKEA